MMSSVIKTKVIFSYYTKGVSDQVSSNSDHKIKSYYYICSNSSTKMGKKKAGKIFLGNKGINGIQGNNGKRGNKGIANWSGFRFRAVLGIQSKYRSKRDFKSEQGLQISKEQSWC